MLLQKTQSQIPNILTEGNSEIKVDNNSIAVTKDTASLTASTPASITLPKNFDAKSQIKLMCQKGLSNFLPAGFPDTVKEDYSAYSFWSFIRSTTFYANYALSTQSIMSAVGTGAGLAAAGLMFIIKDRIGDIGKIWVVSKYGKNFDTNPKFWQALGHTGYDVGLGLDMLTPLVPHLFLPVTSAANLIKSVGEMGSYASSTSVNKHLVKNQNMGEITGKAVSQSLIGAFLGSAVSIGVITLIGKSVPTLITAYIVSTLIHQYASYKAVKALQFDLINQERATCFIEKFIKNNNIPDIKTMNKEEKFLNIMSLFPKIAMEYYQNKDSEQKKEDDLFNKGENYCIDYRKDGKISILLDKKADKSDMLKALMQAVYFEKEVIELRRIEKEKGSFLSRVLPGLRSIKDPQGFKAKIEKAREKSYNYTKQNFEKFVEAIKTAGWNLDDLIFKPANDN